MTQIDHRSEAMARLREGIVALTSSEPWRRHLDCQSRFHRYSFGNVDPHQHPTPRGDPGGRVSVVEKPSTGPSVVARRPFGFWLR